MTRLLSIDDYLDLRAETVEWIVHGLVAKPSTILFSGAPKAGKSFLMTQLGNAVAWGEEFLGQPTTPTRVLYLYVDKGRSLWKNMLDRLRESGMKFSPDFRVIHPADVRKPLNVLEPLSRRYLRDLVTEYDPGLVIVDTFRELHTAKENDSTEMKIAMDGVEEAFGDRAVLLVHHAKQALDNPDGPVATAANSARGSSYIKGAVDALWLLRQGKLDIDGRLDEQVTYHMTRQPDGTWAWSDRDRAEYASRVAQVVGLCARHPATPHASLWRLAQAELGIGRATFYRLLKGRDCAHKSAPTT